ncbi:hypothetical protein LCGC14_3036920 [marine sediment metagenome]|uniref:RNA polymerase alpha subunit C-terminal domain-containing protein n=1 Tax=marine sediment metagenome TaxID=412755 RepID=A0A0F8ZGQ1_9ZZZZ
MFESPEVLDQSIRELGLSCRARKALGRLGIGTVRELVEQPAEAFDYCRNFGEISLNEIRARLGERGLHLKEEEIYLAGSADLSSLATWCHNAVHMDPAQELARKLQALGVTELQLHAALKGEDFATIPEPFKTSLFNHFRDLTRKKDT